MREPTRPQPTIRISMGLNLDGWFRGAFRPAPPAVRRRGDDDAAGGFVKHVACHLSDLSWAGSPDPPKDAASFYPGWRLGADHYRLHGELPGRLDDGGADPSPGHDRGADLYSRVLLP